MTCEGVLFTLPVGYSRLPSAVNDLATTNDKIIMSSTSFHSTATMRYWKMPPLVLAKKNWIKSYSSRFSVETVQNCDCRSEV